MFSRLYDVLLQTHVVAQPVETVDTVREDEAELPAEDPVVEVPVPETVTTAETVAALETVTETVVPEVEPVADAAVEVDGHVVGVAEEPAVEAEAITVENEPAEVRTEVTEVPDTIHLHGTLQWTLCMSVFACTTGDSVLSVLCTCLDNWAWHEPHSTPSLNIPFNTFVSVFKAHYIKYSASKGIYTL